MARLPRLVLPGHAHYVIQRGHNGQPVFADDADRRTYLAVLAEAAVADQVAVHAYALPDTEIALLATPQSTSALSRMMQSIGRRYVSAYNRRHGGAGTLWDGRFRCAVVEPGGPLLAVMLLIDRGPGMTSAGHRTDGARDAAISDLHEYWALGNTPFDREAAYRALLGGPSPAADAAMRRAAMGGWVIGSPAFIDGLAILAQRPVRPRKRGRPARPVDLATG